MAQHGKLGEFENGKEDWKSYTERLAQYFKANDITDASKQRAVLISSCGARTYRLMKDVLTPRNPSEVDYDELVTAMTTHFQPPPSEIMQRYRFNMRVRRPHESVATYLAQLKQLAEYCKYSDSLPEMLRDRLVCGIGDERWQKRLLSEEALSYDKAVKILLSLEAAELEVKDMYGQKPVHQIRRNQSASRSQPPAAAPQLTCYRCGGNHKANKCSFKDAEVHFCHKKGHISTVCRNKLKQQGKSKPPPRRTNQVETQEGTESPEYSLFHFHPEGSLPFTVQLSVNKSLLTMEVDTGATLSLISQATYRKLWTKGDAPPLHRTEARLKSYAGEPIAVEGSINVDVKYLDQYASLPLLVVTGDGPSLLGRDWLKHFKLDWSQLNSVKRDHDASIQQLLDRHPALFKDELGKLEGETAKIYIDSDAKPQFYRARQVPYTLKVQVEAEIDRLVKEGVIEPVQFSEWAAPVVPVLKRDGSVRLCGDYKSTVNRAAKTDTYPLPRIEDLFASLAGGTVFSKLDLAQAYLQVPLDEASKKYVTVNTHRGLVQYNRLPFGVASTPSIFHRIMENVLQGLTGVCAYLDDILVSGKTPEDHMQNLEAVLERLEQAGLRLKRAKCLFMLPSVEYLGFQISAKGLQPRGCSQHQRKFVQYRMHQPPPVSLS